MRARVLILLASMLLLGLILSGRSVVKAEEPLPPCQLTDKGIQLEVTARNDGKWMINRNVSGCNMIFEGRLDQSQEHHIYVLRSSAGKGPYFDSDGNFIFLEGSVWIYPTGWNMDDFGAEKPPIAAEFVNAKRDNMRANGYDWPIIVHKTDGSTVEFPAGTKVMGVTLPNNCDFSEPQAITVSGVYDPQTGQFVASIGAAGCTTVALLDSKVFQWEGAKDGVTYKQVEAWLMPANYSQQQIDAFKNRWNP
jgi:hypothetical protein